MKRCFLVLALITLGADTIFADGTQPPGSGTSGDPYQVSTLDHLLWISTNSTSWGAYFEQTTNIDASLTQFFNPYGIGNYYGFSPIGNATTNFTGFYNGLGHTIIGLSINRSSSDNVGLFGYVSSSSKIENLGLISINIIGRHNVGGLAGYTANSFVYNCYTTGGVSGNNYIGGLAGYNSGGYFFYSYARTGINGTDHVGGFAGINYAGAVSGCYAAGSVSGSTNTGGLLGENTTGWIGLRNFYDQNVSGQNDTGKGATPNTTEEMKNYRTFATNGWDFERETANGSDNHWDIDYVTSTNSGYPYLSWQDGATVSLPAAPSGSGTSGDPVQISTLSDLCWMSQNESAWNQYIIQTNDIDASSTSGWNSGYGFYPIGVDTTQFTGSYNGQNHIISGLTINRPSKNGVGLFGYSSGGGKIENLGLTNVNITGNHNTGGLAGYLNGIQLDACYTTGGVNGTNYTGGLAGYTTGGSWIMHSYGRTNVSGADYVGGLAGTNIGGLVSGCYAAGSVSGSTNTGGLLGQNNTSTSGLTNFFDKNVTGKNDTGQGATPKTTEAMKNYRTFLAGGWDFERETTNGTENDWDMDYIGSTNAGYPYLAWQDGATISLPTAPSGSGTSGDPYQISTLSDLCWMSQNDGAWSQYFNQNNNINASGTSSWSGGLGFCPVGVDTTQFAGSYNGQSYTISGLTISRSSDHVGLFGYTSGATINNLGLTSVSIQGAGNSGALIGSNTTSSSVKKCYATGTVQGALAGGLTGQNDNSLLGQCFTNATVIGSSIAGGVVGKNQETGEVNNCYARGSVTSPTLAGGLAGTNETSATLKNCYATGSVSGTVVSGGLCAQNTANVLSCFYDRNTTGESDTGKGKSKTTANMKLVATFTDETTVGLDDAWDFETNPNDDVRNNDFWDLDYSEAINNGYPFLSWQNGGETSLPVELASFSARCEGHSIVLEWITESEVDNLGFIIERSGENTEWVQIVSYQTHAALRGQGNISTRTEYTFVDIDVEPGESYTYRLLDVDTQGEVTVHPTLAITMDTLPEVTVMQKAYPNPFNPQTYIHYQLSEDTRVEITVFDVLGRYVHNLYHGQQMAGSYQVYWNGRDASGLVAPSGTYVIRMQTPNSIQTQKVLFMK